MVESLLRLIKKEGSGFKEARDEVLSVIRCLAFFDNADVKKGLYECPGLIPCLLSMLGKEGDEWEGAKKWVIYVIEYIAKGGTEEGKGSYETPGLIKDPEKANEDDYLRKSATEAIPNITRHKINAWRLPSDEASAGATSTTIINPDDNELSQMEKKLSEVQKELDNPQMQLSKSWGKLRETQEPHYETQKELSDARKQLSEVRKEISESHKEHSKNLNATRKSMSRMEKTMVEMRGFGVKAPEVLTLDDIEATLATPSPPPSGGKCSNLAILTENNAENDRALKKDKKKKDDTTRQLEDVQDAHETETMCTVCYDKPRSSLFNPLRPPHYVLRMLDQGLRMSCLACRHR